LGGKDQLGRLLLDDLLSCLEAVADKEDLRIQSDLALDSKGAKGKRDLPQVQRVKSDSISRECQKNR